MAARIELAIAEITDNSRGDTNRNNEINTWGDIRMGALPFEHKNYRIKIAEVLRSQYGLTIEDAQSIEKYTTVNTKDGEQWIVKYKSEWYLIEDF